MATFCSCQNVGAATVCNLAVQGIEVVLAICCYSSQTRLDTQLWCWRLQYSNKTLMKVNQLTASYCKAYILHSINWKFYCGYQQAYCKISGYFWKELIKFPCYRVHLIYKMCKQDKYTATAKQLWEAVLRNSVGDKWTFMVILEVTTFSQKQRREHNAFVKAQLKTFMENISAVSWAHSVSKESGCYLTKLN